MHAILHAVARIELAVAAVLFSAGTVEAIEFGASGRIYTGGQDNDGTEIEQDEQRIIVNLGQQFSPWFGVNLSYRFNRFANELEDGFDTERKTTQPQLVMLYSRPTFSAQLTFIDRQNSGTFATDNLDLRSFVGEFHWRPDRGPRYSLRLRDDSNVADAGVFGRDTDSTNVEFDTVFNRDVWTALYSYRFSSVDNNITGLSLDQNRHELRFTYADRLVGGRLSLGGEARLVRATQKADVGNASLAEPVQARAGLFAIDTAPAVSTLDLQPALIDGDTNSAVIPLIQIGGANTFRNIGVDLGFTRPATRLEVYVDAPSDATLVWQVWQSPDNLQWSLVPGSTSELDGARFIYTIFFPDTTARFFKAVNVSVNALGDVNVTEIRALVDLDPVEPATPDRTDYRLALNADYQFSPRLSASQVLGFRSDQDFTGGFVASDRRELNSVTAVRFEIAPDLVASSGLRLSQLDQTSGRIVQRTENDLHAQLDWLPRPTVTSRVGASHRQERAGTEPIRTVDSVYGRAGTQLFPDLWLDSELRYSRVDDPFSGFMQNSWTLRETFDSRPARNWGLAGTLAYTRFNSQGRSNLTRQTLGQLRSVWTPVPFVALIADWNLGRDDNQRTLGQRYTVSWKPGTKLGTVVSYYAYEAKKLNKTTTSSASLTYSLLRGLDFFASLTRTVFEQAGIQTSEQANFRVGIDFIF